MTREEIEKAVNFDKRFHERLNPRDGKEWTYQLVKLENIVDFALEMVRRHNEELQEKVQHVEGNAGDYCATYCRTIREAKP